MNAPATPTPPVSGVDDSSREWALAVATTLRLKQQEHSHLPPAEREQRLETELRDAVQAVPLADRQSHLLALGKIFPSWEAATHGTYAQAKSRIQTPIELVDALVESAPGLAPADREQIAERLRSVGLSAAATGGLGQEILTEIKSRLKLAPEEEIDSQRLGKLFIIFADLTLALDQLVWNLWKGAAPQSSIRREISSSDVRGLVRRSLCGDAEASAAQIQQQVESTRQLIAGLLAGLGSAGQTFGARFQERFAPDAIRSAVEADSSGFFASAEVKCWKHYEGLAPELTTDAIETQVREAVVKYTEDLIRGRKR